MGGKAKYTVMIPKVDGLGNKLVDLASAAHMYLYYGPLHMEGSEIDPDKRSHWRDNPPEQHDILTVYAEDTPETDSHMRQLAVYIGELANRQYVGVVKHGKQGIQPWTINNPLYRTGEPAEEIAMQPQPQPGQAPPPFGGTADPMAQPYTGQTPLSPAASA